MKSWRRPFFLLLALCVWFFVMRYATKTRAEKRRAVSYQAALQSYTQALRPGMTREEVEDYLNANNAPLYHMCCIKTKETSDRAYDDLTKMGQEDVPWYCDQNNIYIAFLFTGPKRASSTADPSDTLTAITLYPHLEDRL